MAESKEGAGYLKVVVMKPIKKGEELTCNYFFHYAEIAGCFTRGQACPPKEVRTNNLSFSCHCSVCSNEENEQKLLRQEYTKIDKRLGSNIYLVNLNPMDKNMSEIKEFLKLVERKLEIGRQVDSLLLPRDLHDVIVTLGRIIKINQENGSQSLEESFKYSIFIKEWNAKVEPIFKETIYYD